MDGRRQFVKKILGSLAILGVWLHPLFALAGTAYAKMQTFLAKAKPARKDGEWVTPLNQFKTMGVVKYDVNLKDWRLSITGNVKNPLSLTYEQLHAFPAVEKNIVLVCPGFFTNHGLWKGVSIKPLLEKAMAAENASRLIITGHNGAMTKKEEFPMKDILSDTVFLAYGVNGVVLPEKHGYPLRVVAEGYQGDDWVKFVYEIKVV
jgi:DMSO/TMAO reductase YedYZ molybdopterin-dependent catalytic subunit